MASPDLRGPGRHQVQLVSTMMMMIVMMIMMIMITQVGLRQPQPPRQAGDERGQGAQGKNENSSKTTGEVFFFQFKILISGRIFSPG